MNVNGRAGADREKGWECRLIGGRRKIRRKTPNLGENKKTVASTPGKEGVLGKSVSWEMKDLWRLIAAGVPNWVFTARGVKVGRRNEEVGRLQEKPYWVQFTVRTSLQWGIEQGNVVAWRKTQPN